MRRLLILQLLFSFAISCKKDMPITSAPIPDHDPIAYYTFTGNANDLSEYANNGTVYNAILSPDSFGNANTAYYFNQEYIEIQDKDILDIKTNKLTVSVWINPLYTSGSYIVQKANYVNNQGQITEGGGPYCLDIFPGRARALLYTNDNNPLILTGTTLIKNHVWQHIALTWDGSNAFLYYNGQIEATGAFAKQIRVTNGNLYIGAYKFVFPNAAFWGTIDNVRIYNRCLETTEIQDLYTNYK